MLVVLLLMGILAGLVSVTTRPDDRGQLQIEAERLMQLLNLAADESRFTGKPIGWTADATGYRFWRQSADGDWREIRDNDLLRARVLPQNMQISDMRVEARRPQGAMRLEFRPYGAALSFAIDMSFGAQRFSVLSSPLGDIRVQAGVEQANAR